MPGTGTAYVDSVSLVDGFLPPTAQQYSCAPAMAGAGYYDSFQAQLDPKCVKSLGGSSVTVPYNTTTIIPFSYNEVDTDQMGTVNNRITIRTDGKYHLVWQLNSTGISAAGDWFCMMTRSGGAVPFRGGTYTQPTPAAYHNGPAFVAIRESIVEDLIAGDYLETYAVVSSGGGSLTITSDYSYMAAFRMGD